MSKKVQREFTQPRWQGEDLAGRTLLVHTEQGFGDTLQFARFIPLIAERGAKIVLEALPQLARLLRSVKGVAQIITGQAGTGFDYQIPIMSLASVLGVTGPAIPGKVPYLAADRRDHERWRATVGAGPDLKVGINWAGNRHFKGDQHRSTSLDLWQPVLATPGIRWFSLQLGERAKELATVSSATIGDLSPQLTDFAETAAVMSNLDLVITSDTAVAHLAGALGRPVWVALKHVPDWRWMLEREDSPWYPTARLFRQGMPDDWHGVFERIAMALPEEIAQAKQGAGRARAMSAHRVVSFQRPIVVGRRIID